jgi:hypothetical protein
MVILLLSLCKLAVHYESSFMLVSGWLELLMPETILSILLWTMLGSTPPYVNLI